MCGRYSLKKNPAELLREYFPGIQFDPLATFTPNEDVRPTQNVPAVILSNGIKFQTLLRWGLVPSWTQDVKPKHSFTNARAESVATKPAFKAALRRKRCIIPADSFYEWYRSPVKGKVPYRFAVSKQPLLLLAGLWDQYEGPIGVIQGFAVLTTAANRSMADVHDRMPVILSPENANQWLEKTEEVEKFQPMLLPESQPDLTRESVPPTIFGGQSSAQFELPM